jgi:hypothetical protein
VPLARPSKWSLLACGAGFSTQPLLIAELGAELIFDRPEPKRRQRFLSQIR